jgi:anti-sigma regulatory factor (Ser/Thr protein kinase)
MNESIPLRSETALSAWIAGGPSAPVAARHLVGAELGNQVEPEKLYDVLLLTTELVTNAVQHAGVGEGRTLELRVEWDTRLLRVSVFDPGGDGEPRIGDLDLETPGGMGLFLVDQLSTSWGVERGRDGAKRVWFELGTAADDLHDRPSHRFKVPPAPRSEPRHLRLVTSSQA